MDPFILRPPEDVLTRAPQLTSLARQLSMQYAKRQVVTSAQLQQMGSALWAALGLDEAAAKPLDDVGSTILPVILESSDPAIQFLPWECLYHPKHGFIGHHNSYAFSRRLQAHTDASTSYPPGPLRALLFTAQPDGAEVARLDTEAEQAQVLEALTRWIGEGWVTLEAPDDGRFATLQNLLKRPLASAFHVVFLSGHGHFHHSPLTKEASYGEFIFESDTGASEAVKDQDLAAAFRGSGVQCVVLSACESGKTVSDALTSGLTRHLMQIIPHVIGMRESISDQAGILFSRAFCDAIGEKHRVDVALQRARNAMTLSSGQATVKDQAADGSAELSQTQWCLPMLFSRNPAQALLDWDFQPQPPVRGLYHRHLDGLSLPAQFIGRRKVLRRLGPPLYSGHNRRLLITGVGGQGKTTLAGQLALKLKTLGYQVFAYAAQPLLETHRQAGYDPNWEEFIFNLEDALAANQIADYDAKKPRHSTPARQAKLLLGLLCEQLQGKLCLLFDNLESVQDEQSRALNHPQIKAWIETAESLGPGGPIVLLTSRWLLPDWPTGEAGKVQHEALSRPSYADFVRYLQQSNTFSGIQKPGQQRLLYDTLGGNFRGLTYFLKAVEHMSSTQESAFLDKLAQAQAELQTNMAIEQVMALLNDQERVLLSRLRAYTTPIPWDGVNTLAQDLASPKAVLSRITAYSLVEVEHAVKLQRDVYQIVPQVGAWIAQRNGVLDKAWLQKAANYQVYLFETDLGDVSQAVTAHLALTMAGEIAQANRFVGKNLVDYFLRRGLYHALLQTWLPPLVASDDLEMKSYGLGQMGSAYHYTGDYDAALDCYQKSLAILKEIGDRQGEGTTLNNISAIYQARGDYDAALDYLQQSLTIRQDTRDRQGEGITLNNISQIYHARGDYDAALDYLQQSLTIQQDIGHRQGEGATPNNMATLSGARGDYDAALDYLQQSLTIQRDIGDRKGEGTTLNNISQLYKARGDYDAALDYLQQSLTIRQDIGDRQGEGATLNNISQIYRARGDYDAALDYLQQSLTIQQDIGDLPGLCTTLFNIGMNHLQKQETQDGMAAFLKVYQIAKQLQEAQVLQALEGLAKQLGGEGLDFWEALLHQVEPT